ncbi:MAG: AMP-binding protein, partial [Lachnospiraceae bacterium]|nr:AMP-binding protein [Lachnospiraceae bacterium]
MSLKEEGLEYITVQDALLEENRSDLNIPVPYEALSYVIYTSGSTGKPKGVMLTNKNLVNFVDDNEKNRETQGYTKRARVGLATAALTFDVSIMEEFIPLSCGMTTVLATQEEILDPGRLSSLMLKNKVEVMNCTPSYLSNLLDLGVMEEPIKALKSIDLGAESFPETLYKKLRAVNPDLYIMNGYGPTEATISCTMQVIDSEDITIGIPNANVHVATFDRDGRLQPPGALGELVIIGDGVGRGYIGRNELTKKSFINLFGKRAYRTGDLVRIRRDGNIEFHGRLDDQVKLRGLRIELGEVQNAINSFRGVVTSIVVVTHGQTDYLAAYFTSETKTDIDELKEHLRKSLAEYMIPQAFMQLDEMPLTANGKVDKKALPVLEIAKEEIVPPGNDLEAELLTIAKEVTGSNDLGVTSSLVSLGLSSIGAIRLSAMIDEKLGVLINVAQIMKKPTIRDIAGYIEDNTEHSRAGIEVYEKRDLYPITENQRGLLIDWQKNENTTGYNIPEVHLFKDTAAGVLAEAIKKTVDAHSYLKTHFVNDEGDVKLKRCDEDDVCVSIRDLDQVPDKAYFQTRVRPFDLFNDNLYRFEIYSHAADSLLFVDIHHTVYDGMSSDIFMEDLNRALSGEAPKSEGLTAYDYALYEKKLMDSDDYK